MGDVELIPQPLTNLLEILSRPDPPHALSYSILTVGSEPVTWSPGLSKMLAASSLDEAIIRRAYEEVPSALASRRSEDPLDPEPFEFGLAGPRDDSPAAVCLVVPLLYGVEGEEPVDSGMYLVRTSAASLPNESDAIEIASAASGLIHSSSMLQRFDNESRLQYEKDSQLGAIIDRLLAAPSSQYWVETALERIPKAQSLSRLAVECDFKGNGVLRHIRTDFLGDNGGSSSLNKKVYEASGALLERFRSNPGPVRIVQYPFGPLEPSDFLKQLRGGLGAQGQKLSPSQYVTAGIVSKLIPQGVCDRDAYCKYRDTCELLAQSPEGSEPRTDRGESKKEPAPVFRPVAVDILFLDSPEAIHGDFIRMIQLNSLVTALQSRAHELEEDILENLSKFPLRRQQHHLRLLFEHCLVAESSLAKGATFERFARGLLSLLPSWTFGESNVYDNDGFFEIDLTFSVNPEHSQGKFWFELFGPLILVECKNHRRGLRVEGKSEPVAKLASRMGLTGAKLGILMCSGSVASRYYQIAAKYTPRDEKTIVILDERDLRSLIDSPDALDQFLRLKTTNVMSGLDRSAS